MSMLNVSTLTRESASPLTRPAVSLLDMATMGERCRERRLELEIKEVAELARRTAMWGKKALTRSAISQLENGITNELKYENTLRLAAALRVYPDWLAFGSGPKVAENRKPGRKDDPAWAEKYNAAHMELLDTIRLYAGLLSDDQARALTQTIKSMVGAEAPKTDAAARIRAQMNDASAEVERAEVDRRRGQAK